MTKPFLILQLRPETEASDNEFEAILEKGNLARADVHRIRLDQTPLPQDLNLDAYAGVIVGGGPGCISDAPDQKSAEDRAIEDAVLGLMPEITDNDFPFLGCCYGIGILAHHLGAQVSKSAYSEPVGTAACEVTTKDPLLDGLPSHFNAFVGHKEAVQTLPDGCVHLVSAPSCPYQMIRFGQNVYATQFHPEADAAGFETRINIYKHKGYFAPEDAESLIEMCRAADVTVPEQILQRFVDRFRSD